MTIPAAGSMSGQPGGLPAVIRKKSVHESGTTARGQWLYTRGGGAKDDAENSRRKQSILGGVFWSLVVVGVILLLATQYPHRELDPRVPALRQVGVLHRPMI